ncbi:MAG: transcription-repair coupling factor [Deltaproteobacteria bacterium]|nr:transcription-repair coupling factor [Deltaproteobacteria bacterium]
MDLHNPFCQLFEAIQNGRDPVKITGVVGAGKGYLLAQLVREVKRTILWITPSGKEASSIENDLGFFLNPPGKGEVYPFPARDTLPYFGIAPHPELMAARLRALQALQKRENLVLIAPITALPLYLPPRESLQKKQLSLKTGEETPRDLLIETMADWGYERETLVTRRGTFAVRGGVVDLFTPLYDNPVRLEFFGDQVESIRLFETESQKSTRPLPEITLVPPKEGLVDEESLSEKRSSFFDYLPDDPLVILDDPERINDHLKEFWEDLKRAYESSERKEGTLLPTEIALTEEALGQQIARLRPVPIEPLEILDERSQTISLGMRDNSDFKNRIPHDRKRELPLAPLAKKFGELSLTERVLFVAGTEAQGKRFRDLFTPYFPNLFPIELKSGELSGGFQFPAEKLVLITEEEIFGSKIKKPTEKPSSDFFSSFAELKEGAPIVHRDHGIGLYKGLTPMKIAGIAGDFLIIEYDKGDKLYLPVYRLSQVQRYVSGDGPPPRLDTLGSKSWAKTKEKAKKAIQAIAGELLNTHAARSVGKGFAFSPPDELYEAFEASFPFEETPDQLRAIQEVLSDMENEKPMDRLILGDVGYGKTEVAMRAAFKAVQDSKQVAILVPTTVLAFQHWENFKERFKEYPVQIEMISRFRSPQEQKKILQETAEGKIDILIGTHRLLQPDVSFKNLALLVIDEEHRFGVAAKERLKKLKKDIDLLSLSATPIPRTLYMSMVGIRPISIIETPPVDRLAIRTFVAPFSEAIIKEALLRELRRKGQVFFVHNRIQSIETVRKRISHLLPEVRIEIAHGEMDEEKLEEAMLRFSHHEFDILLCTTIIESGIDIPNANTILMDHADRLGLAQIYQLRGRVGRGAHRAYCYLLLPEAEELTPEARKRLKILQKFSELGSGFRMASYDLEIRGAGNLFGTAQSGQMAALGYDLYTELLEKAVQEIKGEQVLEEIDPEMHFPIPAFLPDDYIPDPPLRLDLYRRLSSAGDEGEISTIADEMADRFGRLPQEAEFFLMLSELKTLAKKLRIKEIRYDKTKFAFSFDPTTPLSPERLLLLIQKEPKKYQFRAIRPAESQLFYRKPLDSPAAILQEAKKFLKQLLATC